MTYYLVTYKQDGQLATSAVYYLDYAKFREEHDVVITSFPQY